MTKPLCTLAILLLCFLTTMSYAQQNVDESDKAEETTVISVADPVIATKAPEVGKHVMANTDAGSMILSLLMVLALIFISALVLKKFNFTRQQSEQLKVVASLSLGVKERLVVAQIGEQQLVLGITPQQITLIKSLEEPIVPSQPENPSALTGIYLLFYKKITLIPKTNSNNYEKNSIVSFTHSHRIHSKFWRFFGRRFVYVGINFNYQCGWISRVLSYPTNFNLHDGVKFYTRCRNNDDVVYPYRSSYGYIAPSLWLATNPVKPGDNWLNFIYDSFYYDASL